MSIKERLKRDYVQITFVLARLEVSGHNNDDTPIFVSSAERLSIGSRYRQAPPERSKDRSNDSVGLSVMATPVKDFENTCFPAASRIVIETEPMPMFVVHWTDALVAVFDHVYESVFVVIPAFAGLANFVIPLMLVFFLGMMSGTGLGHARLDEARRRRGRAVRRRSRHNPRSGAGELVRLDRRHLGLARREIPVGAIGAAQVAPEYSTCKSWPEVVGGEDLRYAPVIRVSDPGTKDRPAYTGYWFYDGLQFDESGRYALAMKVDFQSRDVTPADRGDMTAPAARRYRSPSAVADTPTS